MSLRLNGLAICASAHIEKDTEEEMTESSNQNNGDAERYELTVCVSIGVLVQG